MPPDATVLSQSQMKLSSVGQAVKASGCEPVMLALVCLVTEVAR